MPLPLHDRTLMRALVGQAPTDLSAWHAISDHAEECGLMDWLGTQRDRAPKPRRRWAGRLLRRLDRDRRGAINETNSPYEADKVMLDMVALGIWHDEAQAADQDTCAAPSP